jgi:hypothetical protein
MGIRNLNRFLQENCSKKAISKKHLKYFANKVIVVDTSIYLYKFSGENALLENMYLLISLFKSYRITPLFIFDGKPPPEKRALLRQRKIEKKDAESNYNLLKAKLESATNEESVEIVKEMNNLKRQMVKVRDEDIQKVKKLMNAYGVIYFDANGEADKLCAYLLKNGKAHACMSDDMDMFLYGCDYVIRNLSLMNHTVVLYDTKEILRDLKLTENQFCEIMVLSGTDYNINSNTSLRESLRWYNEYNKYCSVNNNPYGFYLWLVKNTKYVSDYSGLLKAFMMFRFNADEFEDWNNIEIIEKITDEKDLREIMEKEGFIFTN